MFFFNQYRHILISVNVNTIYILMVHYCRESCSNIVILFQISDYLLSNNISCGQVVGLVVQPDILLPAVVMG